MSELATIARPYAKAAFEFAVDKSAVASWNEMLVFAAEVAKNEQISQFLAGNASAEKQAEIFATVCAEQINEHCLNLIKVMAENQRLLVLPQVVSQFCQLKAEYEKEIAVDVTSAVKLKAADKKAISAALEQRLARKVKLNCSVDKKLVSGLVIKADDLVIDGSIKGKLKRLSTTMQS